MNRRFYFLVLPALLLVFGLEVRAQETNEKTDRNAGGYGELITLFEEFREFQRPKQIDGVAVYTAPAMAEQFKKVQGYQRRLSAIDVTEWPIAQQVDYHVVRAEMNGLEFEHRVRRPWARDPSFYLFSAAGAGPTADGRPRIPDLPMSRADAAAFKAQLQSVSQLLQQARTNLSEASGDLARFAIHFLDAEVAIYRGLAARLLEHHPELISDVETAIGAVKDYGTWLEANLSTMNAPAGIGKENYNWWLKNVHLVPYTWDELYASLTREYEHSVGALKIVEHRNRDLPPLKLVSSADEYTRRWRNDEQYMLNFIQKNELFTVPDYYTEYNVDQWWNSEERNGAQDFFEQCRDRDMLAEIAHNALGHHIDGMMLRRDDRPIRGQTRLYDIDMIRNEGMAFGLEEVFLHAGIYEERPRAEEINLIAKAFRAVRGLADLNIHSNAFTLSDALEFCYEETPYHWMIKEGHEVWFEMQTTTRAPGWHMGMVLGRIQIMKLIGDAAKVRGDDFVLGEFLDEYRAVGMVPIALIRWEMTGLDDEIKKLW